MPVKDSVQHGEDERPITLPARAHERECPLKRHADALSDLQGKTAQQPEGISQTPDLLYQPCELMDQLSGRDDQRADASADQGHPQGGQRGGEAEGGDAGRDKTRDPASGHESGESDSQ